MSNDHIYYFAFRKSHKLYGYWVEIFTRSEKAAIDAFILRYKTSAYPLKESALKFHPKGCFEKIYFPLPEHIQIYLEDPLMDPIKRNEFVWAFIGANGVGKTSTAMRIAKDWQKANPCKKIIIFDSK